MVNRLAPYALICALMLCVAGMVPAQNLVPNPSFEDVDNCPSAFGGPGPMLTPPWLNGFGTTCDVFNTCATYAEVDVPANYFGWQQTHMGEGYIGAILKSGNIIWREYPQAPLVSPMVADQLYYIGMHVSRANYTCAVKNIGMLISQDPPPWTLPDGIIADPQVYWENGYLLDTLNWTVIDGYYVAQGGENTVTIGNFETDASTSFDPGCPPLPSVMSYYYIDDVWITPAVPCDILDVDLGDDVTACFEYTIDPQLGDVHYVWSTGSTDPTITVNVSGVYGLTITDSCRVGSDHIQVTILGNIPVDVGPDSILLCAGDSYDIELDDENGSYVWQDGSTDPEYSIESPGIYSVAYDDGCAQSADTIVVDVLDPPSPFTIGADTILCDDDSYVISFDESLGEFEWDDGSDESSFTIEEAGTYALTISNMCGEESAEVEVVQDESPVVELGPDEVSICNGDILTFDFDEESGNYFWQDSSTSYTYDISTPGFYSVTVSNTCGSDVDDILVTLTPLPQANLGPDIVLCPGQLPDTLIVSGVGITSVHWMDGSTQPQFIVTSAGLYSVTVSNVCGNGADTIQVVVSDILPTVVLPQDMIACEGDSIWLYSTGDQGGYMWQDGSVDDSLLVKTSGQYILEVSTICGIGHDTVNIQFNPDSLFPNLGPDIALCPGNSATLFAGNTFDHYLWQDMSTADSLIVSAPGMYMVTVSNQCGTGTDTVIVTGNGAPPQLSLQDSVGLCTGLKLTLDAGISGVNYLWNDGTQLSTLVVNTPGTYSLTVSNNCGMDMDTVVIINGGTLPLTALGNDIQLCPGETQMIAPDFAAADNWMWQDGSTGPTYLATTAGIISIAATNACGTSYDSLLVTALPGIPPLHLGNDTSLCESELFLLEINIPDVSITWFDGSQNSAITINGSGIYTAEIANACGVSTDTLIVNSLPDVPQLMLGPDQFLCLGEVINFNPAIPNVQYLWQDGSTGSSFSTTQTGLIILTIANECGTSTDSVLITESTDGPQLDLGPDIMACTGDTVTIQAGVGGVAYNWQDGSTHSFFNVTQDAELTLHISNACGVDDDTIAVQFITPPDPDLGPDTLLCNNEVLTLNSNVNPLTTVTWQDGSHGPDFNVTSAGIYVLRQSNMCGDQTDSIVVSYKFAPTPFSLGPDVTLCPGGSVILHAPSTPDQLFWQDGSDSLKITANAEHVYSLTISNECGTTRDEVNIAFDSDIPVVQFDSTVFCPGDMVTLDASQPFDAVYSWSTGASDAMINISTPGEYAITIMTNCYEVTDVVIVVPDENCATATQFFIPNIFSPNGDGVNDVFTVQFNSDAEIISVSGDIFDRWGDHVFGSDQLSFSWDGNFNDKPMNPGVYVYRFTLVYSNGGNVATKKVVGDVTLIR